MGNCINAAAREQRRRHERVVPEARDHHDGEGWRWAAPSTSPPPEAAAKRSVGQVLREGEDEEEAEAGLKVKIVLTRAELEWLMAQIKTGDRRLEDVLHQMGTARAADKPPRDGGWRPGLESILECHEDPSALATTAPPDRHLTALACSPPC